MKNRKRLILALIVIFLLNITVIAFVQQADAAAYKRDSSGSAVTQIQQKLSNWGYYSGSIDGIFGSRTEKARSGQSQRQLRLIQHLLKRGGAAGTADFRRGPGRTL